MGKLRAGFIYAVEAWKKLAKKEKDNIKHKCLKLVGFGYPINYHNQRKIGEALVVVFSSKGILNLCDSVEWAIQYPLDFIHSEYIDKEAVPESFILIPGLNLIGLIKLRRLIVDGAEIHCFYNGNTVYRAEVLDNGQLLMVKCGRVGG